MKQDNAVVIVCMVLLFAMIAWKVTDTMGGTAPVIVVPEPEDTDPEVVVDGPGMIVPHHALRAPYRFLRPNLMSVPEAINRRRTDVGC